nr:MAG TPA: hypothetical protein [Caudoviricetes sp.]
MCNSWYHCGWYRELTIWIKTSIEFCRIFSYYIYADIL